MKIETSKVTKLLISEVERLDPITLYLEDLEKSKGKATIECFGKSWSSYWGGMGSDSISSFILSCHNEYLINCFDRGIDSEISDYDNLKKWFRKSILTRRRDHDLSDEEARDYWGMIDWKVEDSKRWLESDEGYSFSVEVIGEYWYDEIPQVANHEYTYLDRIITAVKAALDMKVSE